MYCNQPITTELRFDPQTLTKYTQKLLAASQYFYPFLCSCSTNHRVHSMQSVKSTTTALQASTAVHVSRVRKVFGKSHTHTRVISCIPMAGSDACRWCDVKCVMFVCGVWGLFSVFWSCSPSVSCGVMLMCSVFVECVFVFHFESSKFLRCLLFPTFARTPLVVWHAFTSWRMRTCAPFSFSCSCCVLAFAST